MPPRQMPEWIVDGFLRQDGFPAELANLIELADSIEEAYGAIDWEPQGYDWAVSVTWQYRQSKDEGRPQEPPAPLAEVLDFFTAMLVRGTVDDKRAYSRIALAGPIGFIQGLTDHLIERKLLRGLREWAWAMASADWLEPRSTAALLAVGDREITNALAWNFECTGAPVDALAASLIADYRRGLTGGWGRDCRDFPGHPGLSIERFEEFKALGDYFSSGLASSPHATADLLDQLSRSKDAITRLHVAENPLTATPTLVEIANRGHSKAQVAARNRIEVARVYDWGDPEDYEYGWLDRSDGFRGPAKKLAELLEAEIAANEE